MDTHTANIDRLQIAEARALTCLEEFREFTNRIMRKDKATGESVSGVTKDDLENPEDGKIEIHPRTVSNLLHGIKPDSAGILLSRMEKLSSEQRLFWLQSYSSTINDLKF